MEADWDLLAVVRGCTTTTTPTPSPLSTAAPSISPAFEPPLPADTSHAGSISPSGFQDFQDSYKPFSPKNLIISCPLDASFNFEEPQHRNQLQLPQGNDFSPLIFTSTTSSTTTTTTSAGASIISTSSSTTHQRSKKRKNLQKRVCQVAAEGLSSDMWAWRKYGQKPIKGSPYPRGYYKCSSSKGCPARKQVERNRLNPKMFIVTYTSEHNHPMPTHRNSLAGSTRHKASGEAAGAAEASPVAMEEKGEIKEMGKVGDCGDEIMELKEMVMNDDFFVGFEELDDSDCGGFFTD